MKIIKVNLKNKGYPIHLGRDLESMGNVIRVHKPSKVLVVTNSRIYGHHGKRLLKGLKAAHLKSVFTMVPEGEQFKTIEQAQQLYKSCLRAGLDRNSMIIGFGGGVIGDLAGFTAATYMRGVQLVHVPTTLLAMVDSSIGGKTGVDLPEGKNLVGSFYQPQRVWIDPSVLLTLPAEQWRNGMAEVVKYGVILDRRFFLFLERSLKTVEQKKRFTGFIFKKKITAHPFGLTDQSLEYLIQRCCEIKASVVKKDEQERKGIREILNFGHTFGHALETCTGYNVYQHGEAVSIGMVMAARVAREMQMFDEAERLEHLLNIIGLPLYPKSKIDPEKMIRVMSRDKKARKGKLRFILPTQIGHVEICDTVPEKLIRQVLQESGQGHHASTEIK